MIEEILTLTGSKALIRSNLPSKLGFDAVERIQKEETKETIGKFGLFDSSSPNYLTYYPDVTAEDLAPQDSEFIYPVFRLLSEVVIAPHQMAIDFTKNNALKNSMPLLLGQSVYVDHEMMTGNVMGVIKEVFWQEAYTTADGIKVPAGINAVLKLDGKSNPKIARGIMMDPPSIHSSSVTVKFRWEKSHPKMADNEFMNQLGTFAKDGNLVSKVVCQIMMYFENSIVPHGADPFAKKLQNGQIVLAKQARQMYDMSFSANLTGKSEFFAKPGAYLTKTASTINQATFCFSDLVTELQNDNTNHNNLNTEDMKFEELIQSLGLSELNLADEAAFIAHVSQKLGEVVTLGTQVSEKTAEIGTLKATITTHEATISTLTAENTELKPFKERVKAVDTATRAEAARLYNIL